MKRVKCYGRVKTARIETSFTKNFFNNNESHLDNFSDRNKHLPASSSSEKKSYPFADSTNEITSCRTSELSDTYFFGEKENTKIEVLKSTNKRAAPKKDIKKKSIKKKVKKFDDHSPAMTFVQPRWSEIDEYVFPVEKVNVHHKLDYPLNTSESFVTTLECNQSNEEHVIDPFSEETRFSNVNSKVEDCINQNVMPSIINPSINTKFQITPVKNSNGFLGTPLFEKYIERCDSLLISKIQTTLSKYSSHECDRFSKETKVIFTSTPNRNRNSFQSLNFTPLSVIDNITSFTPKTYFEISKETLCKFDEPRTTSTFRRNQPSSVFNASRSCFRPMKESINYQPQLTRSLTRKVSLYSSISRESENPQFEVNLSKLLQLCKQEDILPFADIYDWRNGAVQKLGEGTFGEVFKIKKGKDCAVLKVIPISESKEGTFQTVESVYSEIKVAQCLSELRLNSKNNTENFNQLHSAHFVKGCYPAQLINAWDNFSLKQTTYNIRPDTYNCNQLYIILELQFGGKDMESFVFKNAVEAESIFKQVALSLAVAEEALSFEHRDLHLGNLLVKRTTRKSISYVLRGQSITMLTQGVIVAIIDFTLSRVLDAGCVYYNNLAEDESLFNQTGDFQFEVYKATKFHLQNQWHECLLYSNILWLTYLCNKLLEFKYSRPMGAKHIASMKKISQYKVNLNSCKSALETLEVCKVLTALPKKIQDSKRKTKTVFIERNSLQTPNAKMNSNLLR